MAIGINNITSISLENITKVANVTNYAELMINVNNTVYGGWLYFILLWLLFVILLIAAQRVKDQILINAMYAFTTVTLISFFMRVMVISDNGLVKGLLTDKQMWVFPIFAIFLAAWNWATRDT
jgi:hypothetical protein